MVDQLEGMTLESRGRGEEVEGRRMFECAGCAAGVAHEGSEFGDEGPQTMRRRTVVGRVGVDFLERGR